MLWVVRAKIEDLRKHGFGVNSPISWEPSGKDNHYYDWLGPHMVMIPGSLSGISSLSCCSSSSCECLNDHKTPIHPQNQTQCLLFWVVTLQRGRFCLDPWLHLVHHMCAAWGVQVKCSGSNPESVFSSSPWSVDCCCALANADRFLAPVPMLSEVLRGFDSLPDKSHHSRTPTPVGPAYAVLWDLFRLPHQQFRVGPALLLTGFFFGFSVGRLLVPAPFTLEIRVDWKTQISMKGAWQLQVENPAGTARGRFS